MRWNTVGRLAAFLIVAVAIAGVFALKHRDSGLRTPAPPPPPPEPLPRMVDLGADKCIPCKLMAPILKQLRKDYADHFEVVFIDVWKNRDVAREHGVQVIPTQIFYDADGNELLRHQGFFSRADILGAWQDLGYRFPFVSGTTEPSAPPQNETLSVSLETLDDDETVPDEPVVVEPVFDEPVEPEAEPPAAKVIAYYLHWTVRCHSCLTIEATAQQAIASAFSGELKDGRLEWHAHNMELPEHSHLERAFELSTSSLVLAEAGGDGFTRWKVLEKVWDLVETPWDLETYVVNETQAFLAAKAPLTDSPTAD
jgi:thioredoxin 1